MDFDIGTQVFGDLYSKGGMDALVARMAEIRAAVGQGDMLAGRDPSSETVRYSQGGHLMSPYGFYHPSEWMPVAVSNAKRGRIIRDPAKADYAHALDDAKRPVEIRQLDDDMGTDEEPGTGKKVHATTYCLYDGPVCLMQTFQFNNESGRADFLSVYRRGRPGQVDYFAFGTWIGAQRYPMWLDVDRVSREEGGAREIEVFPIYVDARNGDVESSSLESFALTYENGKCVDWHSGQSRILHITDAFRRDVEAFRRDILGC